MTEKIFIGFVKKAQAPFGEITKISMKQEDIDKLSANLNAKGYVNLNILTSQKTGNPYMVIDTFEPRPQENVKKVNETVELPGAIETPIDLDDVIIPGEEEEMF